MKTVAKASPKMTCAPANLISTLLYVEIVSHLDKAIHSHVSCYVEFRYEIFS